MVIGCGGGGTDNAREVGQRSIAPKVAPPAKALIEQADIERAAGASASEAFLRFWSSLQWQAWPEALSYYSPSLQAYVGAARIVEALKFQTTFFRASKPILRGESSRRGKTSVRYEIVDAAGVSTLSSTTWRRENGEWVIVYDSNLDGALRGWAQSRSQQTTDPRAKEPSAQGLEAGIKAGEAQSGYLANSQLPKK